MRNHGIVAVLLGGIFLAPIPAAMGQTTNIAYAVEPRPGYVVFLDNGTGRLSADAVDTIRSAAGAARSATIVRVAGRPDHAEAVKKELVRDGVPAASIVVGRETARSLPKVADGLADPLDRRVKIEF